MTARQRRLLIAIGGIAACALFIWNVAPAPGLQTSGTDNPTIEERPSGEVVASQSPDPAVTSAGFAPSGTGAEHASDRREYALGLHELAGLPPDVSVGTTFELWVTWDPPITEVPDLRRLIPDVRVAEVIPPVTPEGPTAVIVSVPRKRVGDLMYADRYGALSVALHSD